MSRVTRLDIPPVALLRRLFTHDVERGLLIRNVSRGSQTAGTMVGYPGRDGHLVVQIGNHHYAVHRIIFKMFYETEPPVNLDHRDRCVTNNRITNIRAATASQNSANRKLDKRSKTGVRGVFLASNGKYRAQVQFERKRHWLGEFVGLAEAAEARRKYTATLCGEFAP